MTRSTPARLGEFPFTVEIQTRWSDNDMLGHINNVEYYRFFELIVVEFLRGPCGMDVLQAPFTAFAAESRCSFRRPLSWPHPLIGALKIEHMGNSSVRYGVALFAQGENESAADGHWTHVFVDRSTQRPIPIPTSIRTVFERHQG